MRNREKNQVVTTIHNTYVLNNNDKKRGVELEIDLIVRIELRIESIRIDKEKSQIDLQSSFKQCSF